MKQYTKYLSYVCRHKFFVALECFRNGLIWRGLVHDYDKFFPDSFIAYANLFYNSDGTKKQIRDPSGYYKPTQTGNTLFEMAWFRHTRLHKHHWQYWVLATENGCEQLKVMGTDDIIEMICDWKGAGRAQGTPDTRKWWEINKSKMRFHPMTLVILESWMDKLCPNKD